MSEESEVTAYGDRADRKSANPSNSSEFGDFEEVEDPNARQNQGKGKPEEQQGDGYSVRLKRPNEKKGELIGIVLQRLGGNRMEVKSTDGKTRNARVPGRFRRRFWLRPGDAVIIQPWEDDDGKADVVFQYKGPQKTQIKKSGILDGINDEF
jgi:translation initiation factor 1A